MGIEVLHSQWDAAQSMIGWEWLTAEMRWAAPCWPLLSSPFRWAATVQYSTVEYSASWYEQLIEDGQVRRISRRRCGWLDS